MAKAARQSNLFGRLSNVLRLMQARWKRECAYRQIKAELNALTTRELEDRGIDRTTISRRAREAAWGR